eukprot:6200988-Pleurochrysis_carterae.AAC.1
MRARPSHAGQRVGAVRFGSTTGQNVSQPITKLPLRRLQWRSGLIFLTASIPPPLSAAVYSLLTLDGENGMPNMNIMTYVSPVAHAPER